MLLENTHTIYAACDKISDSLVEVLYSFFEQALNSGRHDGGLKPFHKQFNLLLWCNVILNSDETMLK